MQRYREWLRLCDGGDLYPAALVQLYGVAHQPLIDADDDDRPSDGYVVIGALPDGEPILCEKAGEGICIYDHEAGRVEEGESYEDFAAFLTGMISLGYMIEGWFDEDEEDGEDDDAFAGLPTRVAESAATIEQAWERERSLVMQGMGTRDWTPEQQTDILVHGRAYDDDGRAFHAHSMRSR